MRISIATKIFLAITGVVIAFGLPLGFAIYEMHRASRQVHLLNHGYLRLTLAFAEMETIQANARVILDRATDERDLALLRNAFTRFQRFRLSRLKRANDAVAEARQLAPGPDQSELLSRVERDVSLLRRDLLESDTLFERLVDNPIGERRNDAIRVKVIAVRRAEARVTQRLTRLSIALRDRINRVSQQAERDVTTTAWATLGLALGATLAGLGMLLMARQAIRPLGQLEKASQRLAHGEFGDRVVVKSHDEVGALASAFNSMAGALEQRDHDLRQALRDVDALRRENENVVQSVRAALIAVGPRGEVTALNRAATQLFGISEQVVGKPLRQVPPAANIVGLVAAVEQVLSGAEQPVTLEAAPGRGGPIPSGAESTGSSTDEGDAERLWDVVVTPLRDHDGSARGALILAEEATEKVRMRERLLASERLATIGRMAAQIAHEIRNPLSAIGLNVELLDEEVANLPNREAHHLTLAIQREVDRLTGITEEYLRFARLPTPRLEQEQVNDILDDLLAFMHEELATQHITLARQLATDLPPLAADENQLRQAFLNIIKNSCQSMHKGGTLTIATRQAATGREPGGQSEIVGEPLATRAAAEIEVRITDEGSGIAKDHLSKIFEPFFTTKQGGTGLGLALTHEIVVQHGGSIQVQSEPGQGTTFVVRLPVGEEAA